MSSTSADSLSTMTAVSSVDERTPLLNSSQGDASQNKKPPEDDKTQIKATVEEVEDEIDDEEQEAKFQTQNRTRLYHVLPALAIGSFLAAADQTIVVSSHSKIGTELGALDKTSWLATG